MVILQGWISNGLSKLGCVHVPWPFGALNCPLHLTYALPSMLQKDEKILMTT